MFFFTFVKPSRFLKPSLFKTLKVFKTLRVWNVKGLRMLRSLEGLGFVMLRVKKDDSK